jgi:hypothetical protein
MKLKADGILARDRRWRQFSSRGIGATCLNPRSATDVNIGPDIMQRKEMGMEHLRVRPTSTWKIVILWAAVFVQVIWGIYYTAESSLKMMAR